MERVVVSVGGSVFLTEKGPDAKLAREIANVLEETSQRCKVFAVVGGGAVARRYIETTRELGANESALDELGIAVTRANARVLLGALRDAYPSPATSFDEALVAARSHGIVVMGGTHPGHTTDAVAAMMAEKAHAARLVVATNVDGVYDSDPRKNSDAKLLRNLTARELVELTIRNTQQAGSTGVVDPVAARIIERSRIPCLVVNGRKLDALQNALLGKAFSGTTVQGAK